MPTTDHPNRGAGPGPAPRCRPASGLAFLYTLLLVALMGVSMLVVGEVAATLAQREREQALLQIGQEFRQALARYQQAVPGVPQAVRATLYPNQLDELLRDPRDPGVRRHLRRLYTDPMTGRAEWGLVRERGRIVGVHSLSDAVPIKQDGFDPDDARFRGARRYRDWVFMHPPERGLPAPEGLQPGPVGVSGGGLGETPTSAGGPASSPQAGFGPVPPPTASPVSPAPEPGTGPAPQR